MKKKTLLILFLLSSAVSFACQCFSVNTTICGNVEADDLVITIKKIEQINDLVVQCEVIDIIAGQMHFDTIHLVKGTLGSSCSDPLYMQTDTAIIIGNIHSFSSPYQHTFSLEYCNNQITYIEGGKVISPSPLYFSPPYYEEWVEAFQDCIDLPSTRIVRGYAQTLIGNGITNTQIKGKQPYSYSATTDSVHGSFFLASFVEGDTLIAYKNDSLSNGVSVLDIIALKKHILGSDTFTNSLQYIAADVNNSGTISTLDIIKIQKIIMHQIEILDNNTSWRFIDASYTFPIPNNPWHEPFPEFIVPNPAYFEDHVLLDVLFIGIKTGDVNLSAIG